MKNIELTLQYLFVLEKGKRFFRLVLLALPMGIVAALINPITKYVSYFQNFTQNRTVTELFEFANFNWQGLVLLVFFVITLSLLNSIISRNLRVGRFFVGKTAYNINESFFPALYFAVMMVVSLLISKLLIVIFWSLWQKLAIIGLAITMSLVSTIIVWTLLVVWQALISVWLPIMTIKGIAPLPALSASFMSVGRSMTRFLVSYLFPTLGIVAISIVANVAMPRAMAIIVDSLIIASGLVFFVANGYISYYHINNLPREDFTREFFFKRGRKQWF